MEELKKKLQEIDDMADDGKISFFESVKKKQEAKINFFAPKIIEHAKSEEWEKVINITICFPELQNFVFSIFYDRIPDNLKYDFCIQAYTHHGDNVPAVRKAVRSAKKYGAPKLPEELKNAEYITVYRAGEEPINKAHCRISWTMDIEKARFFLYDYIGKHAKYLYKGKIKPADVIAYTDDRNEKEIMQYRKVFDIELLETLED